MSQLGSHWNVHAERGATSVLLARCNPKHEGLLSSVHLPVGGPRYRPCLEDFLEMLIDEFKFDHHDGWRRAIRKGRERWRRIQTRAIVRDAPEEAVKALSALGYGVTAPASGAPTSDGEHLRRR